MDNDSKLAIILLEALASFNSSLIDLAQSLQLKPEVIQVRNNLECRKYRTGTLIEGYVDAELRNDKSLCWWIDIRWNGEWIIDARILLNDSEGQETIYKFQDRSTPNFDKFLTNLNDITQELVQFNAFGLSAVDDEKKSL
jgi:hypothetical protein